MIDTTAIRAEWEPRRSATIYGVEFENGDAATVLAMCDEIDALRRAHALQVEADNAHIARLQNEIVAARADGLVVATLMDLTGAASPDDLVRVVGQMMRRTIGGASNP